ncbi:MAG: Ig-like domain-containing protein [Planctomycetota bacterium]|jgi:hypothetical protein|nr:Ig-like domain-containing protein [Planctomycetota bacterium]
MTTSKRSKIKQLGWLIVGLTFLTAVGCMPGGSSSSSSSAKPIEIRSPQEGQTTSQTTFEVALNQSFQPSSLSISLNGKTLPSTSYTLSSSSQGKVVRGDFKLGNPLAGRLNRFEVQALSTSGMMNVGRTNFTYSIPSSGGTSGSGSTNGTGTTTQPTVPPVVHVVDTVPPSLNLLTPHRGDFVAVGQKLVITGTAVDNVAVTRLELSVDGGARSDQSSLLVASNGSFQLDTTFQSCGLHRVKIYALDAAGNTAFQKVSVYVGMASSVAQVPHGAEVSLSANGLHKLGETLELSLHPSKYNPSKVFGSFNPVWKGGVSFIQGQLDVTKATWKGVDLDFQAAQGGVQVGAKIDDLVIHVKARVKALFTITISGTLSMKKVDYNGLGYISKSNGGLATVSIPNPKLQLQGFRFDIRRFPGVLERIASPYVGRFIEGRVTQMIRTEVAEKLAKTFNQMTALQKDVKVAGQDFNLQAGVAQVQFNTTGGNLMADVGMQAKTPSNPNAIALQGYLSTSNSYQPHLGSTRDLSLAVDDDTLNQALYEGYRAGATNIEWEKTLQLSGVTHQLSVAFLNAYLGSSWAATAGLSSGLPISIDVNPLLAPVVTIGSGQLVKFQAHDVFIDIYVGPRASRQKLFSFRADLEVAVTQLGFDPKLGTIKLGLDPNRAVIDFEVVNQPMVTLALQQFQTLVPTLVRAALPRLTESIEKKPITELTGLPVQNVQISSGADHLKVELDFK